MKQGKTLARPLTLSGVGVHSGILESITLYPAQQGITWYHKSNPSSEIVIGVDCPIAAPHATVFQSGSWVLSTIEHVMAALWALDIVAVRIEVLGNEVPILDGSSLPIVFALKNAGLVPVSQPISYITPVERISFIDGDSCVVIEPSRESSELILSYTAEFNGLGAATYEGVVRGDNFVCDLAYARTFGLIDMLPKLRAHGLARGSSLGNTLVLSRQGPLNQSRSQQEWLHHKVLDFIGDMYLLGHCLAGTVTAHKTGHAFHRKVIEHYYEMPEKWVISR